MENMKFLQARDTIMSFMTAMGFTADEACQVLQMCGDELTAWENRSKLVELQKEEEE